MYVLQYDSDSVFSIIFVHDSSLFSIYEKSFFLSEISIEKGCKEEWVKNEKFM